MRHTAALLLVVALLMTPAAANTLSGEISGAEWFGGLTYVYAWSLDITNPGFYIGIALLGNGAYFILGVPDGSYILTAFQDRDGNLIPSIDDYLGYYGGAIPQPVEVTGDMDDLDIAVAPLPFTTISGAVTCPPDYFGLTFIITATDPLFEDVVNWSILFDLTGNADYTLFVDPGQYYVAAYLDADFSFSRTAEDPQVFWGAPDYPILLDVSSGSAQDINLNLIAPPDADLTLAPQGAPVIIPPGGGSFDYDIGLANFGAVSVSTQVWFDVTLPDGSMYGPVLGPASVNLPAGSSGTRTRTQTVPGSAPAGTYSYNGYMGVYPAIIWDSESFLVEKSATGDGAAVGEWANWGDSFEEEIVKAVEPATALLARVSPNPFNPATAISYRLSAISQVSLKVYDTAGREVATLVDGWREAGTHEVTFDASALASGVYFYRLQAADMSTSGKLLLLK